MSLFPLGQVVATPGALEDLSEVHTAPVSLLVRHANGDWGDVGREDWAANERDLSNGERLFSVYQIDGSPGLRIYIITERDRSVTTLLLPSEY